MQTMMYRVTEVLLEYGILRPPPDNSLEEAERFTDSAMELFQAQGLVNSNGDVGVGGCMFLPSGGGRVSVLLVTPCPADEYDDNLQRKPSPVRFDRTPEGAIILPGRWFLTKIEELADNPTVSEELRTTARRFSRTARVQPLILPSEIPTVALNVPAQDGSQTQLEALPGGTTLTVTVQREANPD
jgi:hypothetical protein